MNSNAQHLDDASRGVELFRENACNDRKPIGISIKINLNTIELIFRNNDGINLAYINLLYMHICM